MLVGWALLPVQVGDGQECPSYVKPFDLIPNIEHRVFRLVLVNW